MEASSETGPPVRSDEVLEGSASRTLIDLSSVPFSAVKQMVQNYVGVHRPQYPCVSANLVATIVERIRSETDATNTFFSIGNPAASGLGHFEYFVLFIVLAISAMTLTWKADNQARAASEAFYTSATKHLQALEDNDEIQALQISLLLAHYAHLCPERADNWTCITQAIRVVLDLGLHKGSPEALDPAERRKRTQLFWVAYGMERSLCGNLRLPLSFPEESITTPVSLPIAQARLAMLITSQLDIAVDDATSMRTAEDAERESSANHIYLYRALETEVHRVLHLEENLQLIGHVEINEWIANMSSRLALWYDKAQSYARYAMLEFRHVQYNHLRMRLHRPTPRLRVRGTEDRRIVLDATQILIDDYLSQERRCRLFYPWHGVHILFEAAAVSLEACWSLRTAEEPLRGTVDHMLHIALPACVDLLTKIGRRWAPSHTSAKRLKPILDEVTAGCAYERANRDEQPGLPLGSALYDDRTIHKHLEELLFSDGPLTWDQQVSRDQAFAMGLGDGNFVFPDAIGAFFEEMELRSWHPNWGLVLDDASNSSEIRLDI